MKLLKYVMTSDSGLAPNPFFGVCSLALCTPNHKNARLAPGDWIVAHSSAASGQKLVYAMRLTKVLDMQSYFTNYPQKRPVPNGTYEQQCGDNLYFREGDRWARVPSAEHNSVDCFVADRGRPVFLSEGEENYWYFGAGNTSRELQGFADRFPWLIKDRQGFSYVYDEQQIAAFVSWLDALGKRGLIGEPRDRAFTHADHYLVSIEPSPRWVANEDNRGAIPGEKKSTNVGSGCSAPQQIVAPRRKPSC
jgi:hypothetical protein